MADGFIQDRSRDSQGEVCDGALAVDLISRAARMRENLQRAVMQAAGRQYSAV